MKTLAAYRPQMQTDDSLAATEYAKSEVSQDGRPYFFWDYEITHKQIEQILQSNSPAEKAWVISRILQYAKWDDIWRYLTLDDIRQVFDQVRFRRPQDRVLWAYALERWNAHA
ncbi:MAG: hypothetical protein R3A44_13810 [Caldilineaceae bacterium]